MKTDIHPDYEIVTVHCSCGNDFQTRSTATDLRVELCSECHPFYTGKQKLVDTGGRIDRFERRYGRRKKAGAAPAEEGAVQGPPAGAEEADVELGHDPEPQAPEAQPKASAEESAQAEVGEPTETETTES